MRRCLIAIAGALLFAAAGCVPSVFPLYTDKDLRFDPALVGEWAEDGQANESWTFTKHDETSYALVVREDKHTAPFEAHLLRLGTTQFLDITPSPDGLRQDDILDIYKAALIPGHIFAKVMQISPVLKMAFLDPKWIKTYLADHPSEIAHALRDSDVILTAPTRDLQAFITKHAGDKDAFGGDSSLKKKK